VDYTQWQELNSWQVTWGTAYDKLLWQVAQKNYQWDMQQLAQAQQWVADIQSWVSNEIAKTDTNINTIKTDIQNEYAPWGRLETEARNVWEWYNRAIAADAMKRQAQLRSELGDKLGWEQSRQMRGLLAEDNQRTAMDRSKIATGVYNNVVNLADKYQQLRWQVFADEQMNANKKIELLQNITARQDKIAELKNSIEQRKTSTETAGAMQRLWAKEQANTQQQIENNAQTSPQNLKNVSAEYIMNNGLNVSPEQVKELWQIADSWDVNWMAAYLSKISWASQQSLLGGILGGNVWTQWQAEWLWYVATPQWQFDWKWLADMKTTDDWVRYMDMAAGMEAEKWKGLVSVVPEEWTYAWDNYRAVNFGSDWTAGIDFDDWTTGTGVSNAKAVSPWKWEVIETWTDDKRGNFALVKYDVPWEWEKVMRFSHLANFDKKMWDTVELGDSLGNIGSTGNSTGTHLDVTWYSGGSVMNASDTMKALETLYQKGKQETNDVGDITWGIIPWTQDNEQLSVKWYNIYDDLLSIWDTLTDKWVKKSKLKNTGVWIAAGVPALALWAIAAPAIWIALWINKVFWKDFTKKVEEASENPNDPKNQEFMNVKVPEMITLASSKIIDDFENTINQINENKLRIKNKQWTTAKLEALNESNNQLIEKLRWWRDMLGNLIKFLEIHYWRNNSYTKSLDEKIKSGMKSMNV